MKNLESRYPATTPRGRFEQWKKRNKLNAFGEFQISETQWLVGWATLDGTIFSVAIYNSHKDSSEAGVAENPRNLREAKTAFLENLKSIMAEAQTPPKKRAKGNRKSER